VLLNAADIQLPCLLHVRPVVGPLLSNVITAATHFNAQIRNVSIMLL